MIIVIYLLLASTIFGSEQLTLTSRERRFLEGDTEVALNTSIIDPITDQTDIDGSWEVYVITAPATINLLGQMMVVASKRDFSFENYPHNRTYKFIQNPRSFQATLLQISRDGYRAFLDAHSSMNRIQLYMEQIPTHLKMAIELLSSNTSQQLVARMLPEMLKNLKRIVQASVKISRGINTPFVNVTRLLGELMEEMTILRSTGVHYQETLEMLNSELQLIAVFREQWHGLVNFFSNVQTQIEMVLSRNLMPFVKKARLAINKKSNQIDRQVFTEVLRDDINGIHRASTKLSVLARTYYDVSRHYIMGRLAGLSRLLIANNDNERQRLVNELAQDTRDVQGKVTEIVNQRKQKWQEEISRQRARLYENIDSLGTDGDKKDVIDLA